MNPNSLKNLIVSYWCCEICPNDTCSNFFCCENKSSKIFISNVTVLFEKLNLQKLGQMWMEQMSLEQMPLEQMSLELIKLELIKLELMA